MFDFFKLNGIFFFILISITKCDMEDDTCKSQKEVIGTAFKLKDPISKYQFVNDTKTSLEVTWIGENTGKIILVTIADIILTQISDPSDIYLSENNGKTFNKITDKMPLKNMVIRKDNGLQRSTVDTNMVFLICYNQNEKTQLIITHDGAISWKQADLPFVLDKLIVYHPTNKMWLLTLSKDGNLFQSIDGGLTWTNILDNVYQFQWGTKAPTSNVIFAKTGKPRGNQDLIQIFFEKMFTRQQSFTLKKYDGKKWVVINKNIFGFLMREKFLYVSEIMPGNRRRLLVSTDEGKTFNRVLLPTIVDRQFYSILDIENDLVFIHVDNDGDSGDGTLFTSDSDGIVFSESLLNHFYPSQSMLSDFYKIQSMRATYLASQLKPDKSITTLITFNRGAEWKRINKPDGEPCHDQQQTQCNLQIANGFSFMKRVQSYLPLSTPTAIGLILAHGHLADSLKISPSDVYSSSDGGYNWMKTLSGPHQYVIADHGGLLVALGENKNVIKFSTDEGRCWHEHQYTTENIQVTGILTEPGNKAMTVAIWGYLSPVNHWVIHVVDLSMVLNRDCNEKDYEVWYPHYEMLHPSGKDYFGCLLGKKETYLRLKKDSLCRNGYSHKANKTETVCPCTEDDYECEYGYYRRVNSKDCVRNKFIKEILCVKGLQEELLTQGYKKIPSDVCEGGFKPDKTKQRMLNTKCNEDDNSWKKENKLLDTVTKDSVTKDSVTKDSVAKDSVAKRSTDTKKQTSVIFIVVAVTGLLVACLVLFVIISRARNIRKRQANLKYRVLAGLDRRNGNQNDDDAALLPNEGGYESTGQTRLFKGKTGNPGDDSDVDLIN